MIEEIAETIAMIIMLVLISSPILLICGIIYSIESNYNIKHKKTIKRIPIKITDNKTYQETEYYKETRIEYNDMITDKGRAGEYATSLLLEQIQGYRKFLFNIYIPKDNNKTTEIDIIMIHKNGIFVIENKNYKGWIIGDETHDQWCEIIWKGNYNNKYFFYNPIRQNANHIKWLKNIIGDKEIYSIIVFNNEARLNRINHTNPDISIINTKQAIQAVVSKLNRSKIEYTPEKINEIYEKIRPYSGINVKEEDKEKHINDIKNEL